MNLPEVLEALELLSVEFGVSPPKVRWSVRRKGAAYYPRSQTIAIGPSTRFGSGTGDALLHEFAHHVNRLEEKNTPALRRRRPHGPEFMHALHRVVKAWGQPYPWHKEYATVAEYATRMKVGDSITLWKTKYTRGAYVDQYGFLRDANVVKDEVVVKVTETRKVPGIFGRETYDGFKAKAEDGREFKLNWTAFPDDSMTPTFYWYTDDCGLCDMWEDAIQRYNIQIDPVIKIGSPTIPAGATICVKHNYAFVQECWRCRFA